MESEYKDEPLYQVAYQRFVDECDYLRLTEKMIDDHIKNGTLTASKLNVLIDCKLDVRAASQALREAKTETIAVQMEQSNSKKSFWKRLLKK